MFQFVKFVNKNFNKCFEKYLFNLMVRTAITRRKEVGGKVNKTKVKSVQLVFNMSSNDI